MNLLQILALEIPLAISLVAVCDRLVRVRCETARAARLLTVLWIPIVMVLPALGLSGASGGDLSMGSFAAISVGPLIAAIAAPLLIVGGRWWKIDQWHSRLT